jgi:DNA-binding CsgD family transcriptional regulator
VAREITVRHWHTLKIELLNTANEIRASKIRSQRLTIFGILLLTIAGAVISFQVIKSKNERITRMILEMRNYMLMLKNHKPSANNHLPSGNERIQSLMDQFSFTRREAEIMNLILEGMTNEEIAEKVFVSQNTVKFHIKNIYLKLDVKNRVQALRKASTEEYPADK